MKKRYSEYVNYNYSDKDKWFNPQVGWDTLLFIDPMLIKHTSIKEFKNSYEKLVTFYSNAISYSQSDISSNIIKHMFSFEEVSDANLGFSYDNNQGSGLTGKTALNVLNNLKKYVNSGLFGVEDFAEISLFDGNVSGDRITDMVLNILKDDFIKYSVNVAKKNNFPIAKFRIKTSFDFNEMRWISKIVDMPYIVDEQGRMVRVLLIPKEFLVTTLYNNDDNLMSWIYHNNIDYVKEVFDYNLKKDITKNKDKILKDIVENKRKELLEQYSNDSVNYEPYDLSEDPMRINSMYEIANNFYEQHRNDKLEKNDINKNLPVKEVARILIDFLKHAVTDLKAYQILFTKGNKFVSEPIVSKFVHVIFEARIKDAGFNVDISPETNAGYGPVDFKISRGNEKVLIENKLSTNPKLLECIDEDKQVHTYLKQEDCKDAFLIVFINKESDIDKINLLSRKASDYKNMYNINVVDVDCIDRISASKR